MASANAHGVAGGGQLDTSSSPMPPMETLAGVRRRKAALIKRGIDPCLAHIPAWSGKGPWALSHTPGGRRALDNRFFDQMGLSRLSTPHRM